MLLKKVELGFEIAWLNLSDRKMPLVLRLLEYGRSLRVAGRQKCFLIEMFAEAKRQPSPATKRVSLLRQPRNRKAMATVAPRCAVRHFRLCLFAANSRRQVMSFKEHLGVSDDEMTSPTPSRVESDGPTNHQSSMSAGVWLHLSLSVA